MVMESVDPTVDAPALAEDVVLAVEGVSKKFCRSLKRSLLYGLQDMGGELLGQRGQHRPLRRGEFWALQDVSFELRRGEALGLIGANGSGKTTLLRIIAGLIRPDRGRVTVRGRVAPLLAAGVGFNPILTGRENIYVNMAVLGLSQQEIAERFEDVVGFAEIGEAIDAPVQSYSSGMQARLGFACAVHVEPDILLLDEVLAVGDMQFRTKCYRRLAHLREQGKAFIIVTHNPHAILSICSSGVYVRHGKLVKWGSADAALQQYEEHQFLSKVADTAKAYQPHSKSGIDGRLSELKIIDCCFTNSSKTPVPKIITGDATELQICCQKRSSSQENLTLAVTVKALSDEGASILSFSSEIDQQVLFQSSSQFLLKLKLPYLGLAPGLYEAKIAVARKHFEVLDVIEAFRFQVSSNESMSQNRFFQPRSWEIDNIA